MTIKKGIIRMNFDVIGLPLAIVFILILLSWFIIKVKIKTYVKLILITITFLVFFGVWNSVVKLKGWAAQGQLPDKYLIQWIIIDEPGKLTKEGGGIFILASDMKKSNNEDINIYVKDNTKEPRLYRISYSRKMHQESQDVIKGLKKGKKYYGTNGKESSKKNGGMNYNHNIEPKFYDMPDSKLPNKK
jgi:hypothetical protein